MYTLKIMILFIGSSQVHISTFIYFNFIDILLFIYVFYLYFIYFLFFIMILYKNLLTSNFLFKNYDFIYDIRAISTYKNSIVSY